MPFLFYCNFILLSEYLFNCCNKTRDNAIHLKSCNPTMMMEELGVYAQVGGQIDIMELLITT